MKKQSDKRPHHNRCESSRLVVWMRNLNFQISKLNWYQDIQYFQSFVAANVAPAAFFLQLIFSSCRNHHHQWSATSDNAKFGGRQHRWKQTWFCSPNTNMLRWCLLLMVQSLMVFSPLFLVSECNTWRYCSNSGLQIPVFNKKSGYFFGIRSIHDLPCFEATKPLMSQAFFDMYHLCFKFLKRPLPFDGQVFRCEISGLPPNSPRPDPKKSKARLPGFGRERTTGRLRGWWTNHNPIGRIS